MCIHVTSICEMLFKECHFNLQRCTGLHALLVALVLLLMFSLKACCVEGPEKEKWTETSIHML